MSKLQQDIYIAGQASFLFRTCLKFNMNALNQVKQKRKKYQNNYFHTNDLCFKVIGFFYFSETAAV